MASEPIVFVDAIIGGEKVKEFNGYLVYRDGRIFLKKKNRFAKISTSSTGYSQVFFNGESRMLSHIVVLAWGGATTTRVSYKDFNIKNNHFDNLIWR